MIGNDSAETKNQAMISMSGVRKTAECIRWHTTSTFTNAIFIPNNDNK